VAVRVARKSWLRVETAICLVVADAGFGDAWASPSGNRIADEAVTARTSPATRDRRKFIFASLGSAVVI
jgi:hypothetical protein